MRDFVIEDGTELDVGRMKIGKGTVIKKGCRIRCKELDVGNDVLITRTHEQLCDRDRREI